MGLIRVLMFALAGLVAYLLIRRMFPPPRVGRSDDDTHGDSDERLGRLVLDPQCGVYVDSKEAVRRSVPDGELFFCSKGCADTYLEQGRPGA